MDDPFFAEDDGDFDDFYGTKSTHGAASKSRESNRTTPAVAKTTSMAYPDTPASSVASFVSKSTDGGIHSATQHYRSTETATSTGKTAKKSRRRRSQDRFDVEWENDADVTACFVCSNEFSLLKRKHHCRHCGRVICSDCSSYWRFPSTHKKHRVCSYCKVELASAGAGRNTMADSLSDAEPTPDSQSADRRRRGKLRDTIAGVFSSTTGEKNAQVTAPQQMDVENRGGIERRDKKQRPPSSDLFNTSDDTWFVDPVVDEDDRRGKSGQKTKRTLGVNDSKTMATRPAQVREPNSLFDVQFTDNQSDLSDSGDTFGMPIPTDGTRSMKNDERRRNAEHGDGPMTLDELDYGVSYDTSSRSHSSHQHSTTGAIVPATFDKLRDLSTFYDADADKLVVDDSPRYYDKRDVDSTHQEQKPIAAPMPRPSVRTPASDDSSAVMVEVPETPALTASSPTHPIKPAKEQSGFAGALKRFFGMAHKQQESAPEQATPTLKRTPVPAPPPAAQLPSASLSPPKTPEPMSMPLPVSTTVASADDGDDAFTYDDVVTRREEEQVDERYTMLDSHRFRETYSLSIAETGSFRHTVSGYLAPTTRGLADSVVRASIAGRSTIMAPTPTYEQTQTQARTSDRQSTRNRRDTFDELFDSPTKKVHKIPDARSMNPNLPSRSWATASYGAGRGISVDRFDRPRAEEPEDDLARDLGLPSGVINDPSSAEVKTPWNAVSSFHTDGQSAAYAIPDSFSGRDTVYASKPSVYDQPARDFSYNSYDRTEEKDHFDVGESSPERRTIMDEIQSRVPSAVPGVGSSSKRKDSVDDYFADFEKTNEYVFDTVTGTYVPANAPRSSKVERTRESSRSSSNFRQEVTEKPSKPTKRRPSVRTTAPTLEPVDEAEPDEIDGIIADKISTLAGELEALKNLLRQRRGPRSPSSARRKQSIFDSDCSDVEEKPMTRKSSKRRPSSRKDTASDTVKASRQKRKDSFASLFEEDPADEPTASKTLGSTNYDALFQLGSSARDGDQSDSEKPGKTSLKALKRATKQRKLSSDDEDGDDSVVSQNGDESTSRFASKRRSGSADDLSNRFKSKSERSTRREGSAFDGVSEVPTSSPDTHKQSLAKVPSFRKHKKPKEKDAIDALFDSGSDGDMEYLFDTKPVSKEDTSKAVPVSIDQHASSSERESDSSKPRVKRQSAVEVTERAAQASSDEEFSSNLKSLRNRRRSKPRSSKRVETPPKAQHEVEAVEEKSTDEETPLVSPINRAQSLQKLFANVESESEEEAKVEYLTAEHESHAGEPPAIQDEDEILNEPSESADVVNTEDHSIDKKQLIVAETVKKDADFDPLALLDDEEPSFNLSKKTKSTADFDPLALLDDEEPAFNLSKKKKKKSAVVKGLTTVESALPPQPESTVDDFSDITTISSRLKASRFRDSLLDDDNDLLGPTPSLNIDDMLGDSTSDPNPRNDEEENSSSDDDQPAFSFEIKPKKKREKTSESTQKRSVVPEEQAPSSPTPDPVTPVDVEAAVTEPSETDVVNATTDDELAATPVDDTQFHDNWQRLQDLEKERKKKLQLKQRQAQREKLKKQTSSGRSLGKLGSSRGPSSSLSSRMAADADREEGQAEEKKTRKKTNRHEGNAAKEDNSRQRKAVKHRHRRDGDNAETPDASTEPASLTEL